MKVLRTPDERFQDLDAFPYHPSYEEINDGQGDQLRMHFVDVGPKDAPSFFACTANRHGLIRFEK